MSTKNTINEVAKGNLPKCDEIRILQILSEKDSYFKDAFGAATIALMCENIQSDFPLTTGIDFAPCDERVQSLSAEVVRLEDDNIKKEVRIQELETGVEALRYAYELFAKGVIFRTHSDNENIDSYEFIVWDRVRPLIIQRFGLDFLVKYKLEHAIPFNHEERNYLISKIS